MSTSSKKITLKSSDGETFEVEEAVALKSETIKHMIELEVDSTDSVVPITRATGKILAKVIEYCEKHVEDENNNAAVNEQLNAWNADFVKVDITTVVDLTLVANFLNIQGLLDLTIQTIADAIKGKTPEEIRQFFNIKNDYTPEEEEEIRRENEWAFE